MDDALVSHSKGRTSSLLDTMVNLGLFGFRVGLVVGRHQRCLE
jgi:hypothetical protein